MPVYAIVNTITNNIERLYQQLPQEILNASAQFPNQPMHPYVEEASKFLASHYQYIPIDFQIMPYYTIHVNKNENNEYYITYKDTRPVQEQESTPLVE